MRGTIDSRLLAGMLYASATLLAQTGARRGEANPGTNRVIATPYNALRSPEVNEDRTVTLRFRAPEATAVDLVGEITLGKGPQRMVKGQDGIWTVTVGP